MSGAVVRARIDERVKREAAAVLSEIGLTVSDAFRMMMVCSAKEKALPFEPKIPTLSCSFLPFGQRQPSARLRPWLGNQALDFHHQP